MSESIEMIKTNMALNDVAPGGRSNRVRADGPAKQLLCGEREHERDMGMQF